MTTSLLLTLFMMLLFIVDRVRAALLSSWKSVILTTRRFFNGRSDPGNDILLRMMSLMLLEVLVLVLVVVLIIVLALEIEDEE